LTVGIVTIPFGFEGKKRKLQADAGLDALKQNVDTLLVISNDKLREIYGNLKVTEAFGHADDILATAAKGIADIITTTLQINTDINDVKTVMKDSGVAIMGSAQAEGESRALRAVEQAMSSPLLNDSNIKGARYVLVNVTCGEEEITMDELGEITDYIQDEAGMTAEVIKGYGVDLSLGASVNVTIIATGFNSKSDVGIQIERAPEKRVFSLMDEPKKVQTPSVASNEPHIVVKKSEEAISSYIKEEPKKEETDAPETNEPFVFTKEEPVSKTEQTTFEFEITNVSAPVGNEEPFLIANASEEKITPEKEEKEDNTIISKVQTDEQLKKAQDRVAKLKELSFKLKSPNGLSELENEPAYKRRNINLESTPHSSESQVSRYTLSENDEKKVEIRPNNSFLHDNVD
ncbi:MAG TPA: cell division protein FtsZ, partial [Chitinophagales bacterium]|nr:cell division protein FtsZ [Chitinophagales bacterium]